MTNVHIPVLLNEIIGFIKDDYKTVFDGTFGGGGHTKEILERFKNIKIIAVDVDDNALKIGEELEELYQGRLIIRKANFKDIDAVLANLQIDKVDFLLADLGISSNLLEDGERGFSFMKDGPLDMRMDKSLEKDAEYYVNNLSLKELEHVFKTYGEEPRAHQIAKKIIEERKKSTIKSTGRLTEIILSVSRKGRRVHPATLIFQALRILVNKETEALKDFLIKGIGCLNKGGRMAVISFHSIEDRIVKTFFRDSEKQGIIKILTKKPVVPDYKEIRANRRARSAKLRVAEIIS